MSRPINGGWTALMHAAANGKQHAVKMLLDENVDATIIDEDERSAADIALLHGNREIATLINVYRNDNWQAIT